MSSPPESAPIAASLDAALRPVGWDEYVGQGQVVEKAQVQELAVEEK